MPRKKLVYIQVHENKIAKLCRDNNFILEYTQLVVFCVLNLKELFIKVKNN